MRVGGQGGNAFICEDFPFIGLVGNPFIVVCVWASVVCEDFPFIGSVDFPFIGVPFIGLVAGFFCKIPNKSEVASTIPGLCGAGLSGESDGPPSRFGLEPPSQIAGIDGCGKERTGVDGVLDDPCSLEVALVLDDWGVRGGKICKPGRPACAAGGICIALVIMRTSACA